MTHIQSIAAIVPIRHDSDQIIQSRIARDLDGEPMFSHVVRTLLTCASIDRVVIDTDSSIIQKLCIREFPQVIILDRPASHRSASLSVDEVLTNTIQNIGADLYLQTGAGYPFLSNETIETAIAAFRAVRHRNDSLFSVTKVRQRIWDASTMPINHDPKLSMDAEDLWPAFVQNGAIHLFTRETLETHRSRIGRSPMMFEIDRLEAQEIRDEMDFALAELMIRRDPTAMYAGRVERAA